MHRARCWRYSGGKVSCIHLTHRPEVEANVQQNLPSKCDWVHGEGLRKTGKGTGKVVIIRIPGYIREVCKLP